MRRLWLFCIGLAFLPLLANAQVFNQSQVITSPYGSNGFVVSTTTGVGNKLSATSTPYFANFYANNAHVNNLFLQALTAGTLNVSGTGAVYSTGTTSINASTGISFSANPGALIGGSNLTITNTGVTSLTATSPLSRDTATGAVTISCPSCATGGAFPFSADTNYGQVVYSTSTPTLWFKSGVFASSTSYFDQINIGSTTNSTMGTSTIFGGLSVRGTASSSLIIGSNLVSGNCAQASTAGLIVTTSNPCGTVTSVATNNGLTGGTITTSGTIGLATINKGVLGTAVDGSVPTSQATSTLYGTGTPGFVLAWNNGVPQWVATSSINNGVTSVATNNGLTGGTITTTGTIGLAAINGGNVLANNTSASAAPSAVATSTFFGSPTPGRILAFLSGKWTDAATTTFNSPLTYANGAVSCSTCNTSSASVTSIATTWPISGGTITTSGTLTWAGLASTSNISAQQILYATGVNSYASAATSSLTASGVLSLSQPISVIGGSNSALTVTGGSAGQVLGWLSGVPTWTASSSVAAGTGIAITTAGAVTTVNLGSIAANSFLGCVGPSCTPVAVATTSIFTGSTGQFPFFSGTNTLIGTSSLFASTLSFIGIGSTTPFSRLSVGTGAASSSITVAEYKYGISGNVGTSTTANIDCNAANQIAWPIGFSATTLTLINMTPGKSCRVVVQNPNGTAGALTWATGAGILMWATAGTGLTVAAPTQVTSANNMSAYSFIQSAGSSTLQTIGAVTQ